MNENSSSIVPPLSKCLQFMTFGEGRFVMSEALETLSPSVLQKTKEGCISQIDYYDAPFSEQQLQKAMNV